MSKYWPIVALLLLVTVVTPAAAAQQPPEQKSANARKVLVVLAQMGVNDPQIKSLVSSIDARVKDGYFTLAEGRVANGTLKLHFETSTSVSIKKLELRYTPDNSNWMATARTDGVMVTYNYKF